MSILYQRCARQPIEVRFFTMVHDCWIVGSAARYLVGDIETVPKDWDVIVSPGKWPELCRVFRPGTPTNRWGGLKYINRSDDVIMDIWPEDLGEYLATCDPDFGQPVAVQPRRRRIIRGEIPCEPTTNSKTP